MPISLFVAADPQDLTSLDPATGRSLKEGRSAFFFRSPPIPDWSRSWIGGYCSTVDKPFPYGSQTLSMTLLNQLARSDKRSR
jgi:hypothetical protein